MHRAAAHARTTVAEPGDAQRWENEGGTVRPTTATVSLAGDVMIGRLVDEAIVERGPEYVWGDMLPLLRASGPLMVNLECALTDRRTGWPDGGLKPFHFRSSPRNAAALRAAGVGLVSIANNHIFDFGPDGLLDTLRALDAVGIAHVGAGRDAAEAERPAVVASGGTRIAVIGAADYPEEWAAGPGRPGMNFLRVSSEPESVAALQAQIAAARRLGDIVVFSIHWGPNMRTVPPAEFRQYARTAIDAGASVFWGHSAHVVQGIEFLEGGVVLYDTGDLVDDYAVDPILRNDLSALFRVTVGDGVPARVVVVPVLISGMQVNHAPPPELRHFTSLLRRRCHEMGTGIEPTGRGRVLASRLS